MNTNLMATLSLVVIIALFAVLVGFVQYLTRTLARTGNNLASSLAVTTTIRQNCENIVDSVLALNSNLNAAAAGLTTVVGSAKQRATSLSSAPVTTLAPPGPDQESRPLTRWAPRSPSAPRHSSSPTRTLREPTPAPTRPLLEPSAVRPLRDPTSTRTLQERSGNGDVRRELRLRGEADREQA